MQSRSEEIQDCCNGGQASGVMPIPELYQCLAVAPVQNFTHEDLVSSLEQSDWAPFLAAAGTSLVDIGITPDPSSSPVIIMQTRHSKPSKSGDIQFNSRER